MNHYSKHDIIRHSSPSSNIISPPLNPTIHHPFSHQFTTNPAIITMLHPASWSTGATPVVPLLGGSPTTPIARHAPAATPSWKTCSASLQRWPFSQAAMAALKPGWIGCWAVVVGRCGGVVAAIHGDPGAA